MDKEIAEKLAEVYVNGIPMLEAEGEGFSRTQMQQAFLAGRKTIWHNVLQEKPKKSDFYLCYRMWKHQPIYELIYWTGDYWTTGGDIDDIIIAWCDFPKFEGVNK